MHSHTAPRPSLWARAAVLTIVAGITAATATAVLLASRDAKLDVGPTTANHTEEAR